MNHAKHILRSLSVAAWSAGVVVLAGILAGPAQSTEIGAYRGPGCDGRAAMHVFEDFLGRKVDRTVDALNAKNWAALKSSIPWIARCWKDSGIKLTLSIPILPADKSGTLEEGANGAYDAVFLQTAHELVRNNLADSVIRIGWEFNGSWMPWAASKNPDAFIRYFRRIVFLMRGVEGQRFKFEWCPNHGREAMDPTLAYPGDDVVDIIGMDVYNNSWNALTAAPGIRWLYYLNQPFGLKWHRDFAAAHGKPTSFPEWGSGDRPGSTSVGDDPAFIAGMADWFDEIKPLYQSYWDIHAHDYNSQISDRQYPRAAEVFRKRFGRVDAQ
jgi:hypothetical protein